MASINSKKLEYVYKVLKLDGYNFLNLSIKINFGRIINRCSFYHGYVSLFLSFSDMQLHAPTDLEGSMFFTYCWGKGGLTL
jgi:hypothetical protein